MKSACAGNIKRIIKERGLKQKKVANDAGYKENEFSNMLNGRKLITDEDIIPICSVLEVTPNELLGYGKGA